MKDVELSEILDIQNGYPFDSGLFNKDRDGLPLVRIRDVIRGVSNTYTTEEYSAEYFLKNGDLLIGMDGEFNIEFWNGGKALLNQRVCRISPKTTDVHTSFIRYHLQLLLKEIEERTPFVTVKHLSSVKLKKERIILPPLHEQKRIAAILEKADRLRRLRRYARKLSDSFLQSVFLEMFGDPVRNPRGWPKENLSRLCNPDRGIKAGPFGSSLKKSMYSESGYRIYGQEQVIAGDLSIGDYYIDETLFEDMKSYEVRAGDVLISLVGSFGKTLVVPSDIKPGIINPRLLRVRPDSNVLNSIFLANLLENDFMQAYLMHISHGGTMGILNAGLLRKLEVIVPPIDVQNRYSMIMSEHNHLQSLQSESERQVEHLFQSLLHRAFRGEL